jgi:micrococcal nuclease
MDRYGRSLARVTVDGEDLAVVMVREGLARPYRGEKRASWCGV